MLNKEVKRINGSIFLCTANSPFNYTVLILGLEGIQFILTMNHNFQSSLSNLNANEEPIIVRIMDSSR